MYNLLAAALLILLPGCSKHIPSSPLANVSPPNLRNHVIAFDTDGHPVYPHPFEHVHLRTGPEEEHADPGDVIAACGPADPVRQDNAAEQTFKTYIEHLLKNADRTCDHFMQEREPRTGATRPVRKILIHVHGGLTGPADTAATARLVLANLEPGIYKGSTDDWHYPILVSWQSDGWGCYVQHLFEIRQGRRAPFWAPATAPVFLAADLLRGFSRILTRVGFQLGNDSQLAAQLVDQELHVLPTWRNAYETANAAPHHRFKLSPLVYKRAPAQRHALRFLLYAATVVPKMLTQTVILDGMGQSAWDIMLYRTNSLFHTPDEFQLGAFDRGQKKLEQEIKEESDPKKKAALCQKLTRLRAELRRHLTRDASGGMNLFFELLREHIQQENNADYELTLVGHSMGAIVLNKALASGNLHGLVQNIVYMAPACSIQEAVDSVVPFLKGNPKAKFHLLVLHPLAEAAERNVGDTVQRGTLLEWIDNWWTTPTSHAERRLGKWINVMQALHLFKDVKERVTVKAFAVDRSMTPESIPQNHGDFNRCRFWEREFWDPEKMEPLSPAPDGSQARDP